MGEAVALSANTKQKYLIFVEFLRTVGQHVKVYEDHMLLCVLCYQNARHVEWVLWAKVSRCFSATLDEIKNSHSMSEAQTL
jgi:hypothetical protein